MAGHSKWANIQHRKKGQDAKRGKLFTKLIREITVSSRAGGSDQDANPRLRLAVEKAYKQSMPKDTVERAIKRGAGELEGDNYEESRYEGYGPGGTAVMVDCLTDNKNRTVSEVRHAFSKSGGNMGTDGSVSYMFNKVGLLSYPPGSDEDAIMEAAMEAGADDIVSDDGGAIEVLTAPEDFEDVQQQMADAGFAAEDAEVTERAENSVEMDLEGAEKVMRLLDMLEDLDDVQKVYSNADIPDAILDELDQQG
jgi:YebC/PmpR family DNA-binding regulatory protein